ncbi:hypothetical protein C479_07126 [Halovivax asiaticus JCM 14624]|uniref:CARDB domain-containing protein n=1 Tax=Halovivax asiaticus JCM 14624 TaxID=1227490 RepID=M0BL54_9EURY|nr:CARDB domain-containing protein [Halovivax asiaticus]ELZ11616.1 hypothetical protein C479_07126 [Halovivax asiaticus JCM 14624]
MTRTTWLTVLALGSLLLAVPTAAVGLGASDTTTESDATEAVELTPRSEYATIEDGELTLDFDRLNVDARTDVDAVFDVTTADDSRVWVEHDVHGVTFYDGDRKTAIDAADPASLSGGESITLGVSIDTHEAPTGTESFSVVVETADEGSDGGGFGDGGAGPGAGSGDEATTNGKLAVEHASVDVTNVTAGERVTVTATVSNPTDRRIADRIPILVDGAVVDDRGVELAPNETRTLTVGWTPESAGVYRLSVGETTAGTVAVSNRTGLSLSSVEFASPLTAAIAPPATLGLVAIGRVARGRRR